MSFHHSHRHHRHAIDERVEALMLLHRFGRIATAEALRAAADLYAEPGRPMPAALYAEDEPDPGHLLLRALEESRRSLFDSMQELRERGRGRALIMPPVPHEIAAQIAGEDAHALYLVEGHGGPHPDHPHPHPGHGHPHPDPGHEHPHPGHPPPPPDHGNPGHGHPHPGHPVHHPPDHRPGHHHHPHAIAARTLGSRAARSMLAQGDFKLLLFDGFRVPDGAFVRRELWDFLDGRVPEDCDIAVHARPTSFPDDEPVNPTLAARFIWV